MAIEQLTGMPLQPFTVSGFGVANEIGRRAVGLATGRTAVTLDLDGTTALSERVAMRNRYFELGSGQTLTADETLELPAASGLDHAATKVYALRDATSASAFVVKVLVSGESAGNAISLPRGEWVAVWSDGTNVEALRTSYRFQWFTGGTIGSSAKLIEVPVERTVVLPDGLPFCQGYAGTAPSGSDATFNVQRNGSTVGTMVFPNGVQTATFSMSGDETYAAGDRLAVVENGAPASIADVGFTLHGFALGCV